MIDSIAQLDVLKRDFLGMPFQVEFDTYHLSGIAEGLTITENMTFVDWEDACNWAGRATMNLDCPFVVLEMRNPITGEKENL